MNSWGFEAGFLRLRGIEEYRTRSSHDFSADRRYASKVTESFCEALGHAPDAGVEGELAAAFDASMRRASLPEVLSPYAFARYVAPKLLVIAPGQSPRDAVAAVHLDDLYVAFAALCGSGAAAAIVGREVQRVELALGNVRVAPHVFEDARQALLERLLVPAQGGAEPPRIAKYDGRGPLGAWLRVTLARDALHLNKSENARQPSDAEELLALPGGDDPELLLVKNEYRAKYKEAFEAAVAALESRERALLRQHLVLTMTVDEIGTVYGVHRATAARWVASAKETLMKRLLDELRERFGVTKLELERARDLIESRLDLSVHRLFQSTHVSRVAYK